LTNIYFFYNKYLKVARPNFLFFAEFFPKFFFNEKDIALLS